MSSSLTTFKFDAKLTAALEELKSSTGVGSKAEVVRRAIALLKVVQNAKDKGEKVVLQGEEDGKKTEREIVLP